MHIVVKLLMLTDAFYRIVINFGLIQSINKNKNLAQTLASQLNKTREGEITKNFIQLLSFNCLKLELHDINLLCRLAYLPSYLEKLCSM